VLIKGGFGAVVYLAFAACVLYALWLSLSRVKRDFPGAVAGLIAGICLLDCVIIAGRQHALTAGVALGCFALTLFSQRRVQGT